MLVFNGISISIRDFMGQDTIQSLKNIFSDADTLYAYFAGVFESNGYIRILEQGGISIVYGGSEDYLLNFKDILQNGTISSTQSPQFLIFGNAASKHLKNIFPYLLLSKKLVKLACNYQDHINSRKGSRIDQKEHNYRLNAIKEINNFKFREEIDFNSIDNWIFPYFIGFFDSSVKISINNKDGNYWISVRLKTKFEQILLLFQEIFRFGYVYPTRSSNFRWMLTYDDAHDLLLKICPYLFQNKKKCETAIKIHEYFEQVPKPLNEDDTKFIESLKKELRYNQKGSKNSSTVSVLICDELIKKIDDFIKDSREWNRNSFVKESIEYFYKNQSKIPKTLGICNDKTKEHQINLVLDNEIVDCLNKNSKNRSELIRKLAEVYLKHLQNLNKDEEKVTIKRSHDGNPLKFLKEIRRKY